MANTNNPHGFLWEKTDQSGSVKLKRMKTASNTSLKVGDPVSILNGLIKLAGATTTALYGVAAESIVGVAGTRNSVALIPAVDGYIFSGQHLSTLNLTAGYLGKRMGIISNTSGKCGISGYTGGTTGVLQIVGLKSGSAWGTYAQLMVAVIRSSYAGSVR